MINQFLDWAQTQQDGKYNYDRCILAIHASYIVWIVSSEQLLSWVQNPVPASQLNSLDAFKCSTPQVDASQKICNGIPQNEEGLLDHCAFSDFPFYTCVRSSFLPI